LQFELANSNKLTYFYYRLSILNKTVLGIDIGAKFVMGFYLDEIPTMPYPDWYRKHSKGKIYKIKFDNDKNADEKPGVKLNEVIELLLELKPDVIVMEPTGVWYSRLWATIAEQLSIEVKWIGHQDLHAKRGGYGFKDKDDRTDAFCLALTYLDPSFDPRRWITWRSDVAGDIHRTLLEIRGLERMTTPLKNQLHQRLKYEFPEIADRKITNRVTKDGYTAWLGWLAGVRTFTRIENFRKRSIATQLGIEISDYTREHALLLTGNQVRKRNLESKLNSLLAHSDLTPYIKVCDRLGFGQQLKAAIVSNIYPFDKFLLDGRVHIERWETDVKEHKRNRSRAAMQISLGMGKRLIESGSSTRWRYAGSGMCRSMLYCWMMTNVLTDWNNPDNWLVSELDRKASLDAQPNNNQQRPKLVSQMYREWKTTKGGNQGAIRCK
jgi:hypothetical protein